MDWGGRALGTAVPSCHAVPVTATPSSRLRCVALRRRRFERHRVTASTSSSTAPALQGQTALVTGVSRRRGIGFAVASEFARRGASVFIHHFRAHDLELPWGGDDLDAVRAELSSALIAGASLGDMSADLRDPDTIPALIEAASALTG